MGKSAKKSATKVVAAPAAAVTKPLKQGKRDAEEIVEKPKSAKKPKNDVKEAIAKKVAEVKTVQKKVPKSKVAAVVNGTTAAAAAAKNDDSDSEDDTSFEEDDAPAAIKKPAIIKADSDDSDDSDSEEGSSDDDAPAAKAPAAVAKESTDDSEDDGSEESSDEEEPKQEKKKVQKKDVEMVDAEPTPKKEPKTPVTPKVQQSEGTKTIFVGNLPFSVEKSDVENFFKEVGEVVDVRFALRPDGEMKGFGHIEFASAAEAKKAVEEMNGEELLGRALRLDLAREKGEYTPQSGNAFQKQTIFIRGLDIDNDEFKIKDALKEHFKSCGEITRISVPSDSEGCVKGIAYMDFTDKDALDKALKLDQSECGPSVLTVEEAKPRDNAGGGRGGGRRGGRFSNNGGRFGGGRDSGGRNGGRRGRGGRGGGGRFGGGRGR